MQDIYALFAAAALFVVAFLYIAGCDRIKAGASHD
jgi:hypothetical protein